MVVRSEHLWPRSAPHLAHDERMMLAAMRVVWGGVCEPIRGSTSPFSNREAAGLRPGSTVRPQDAAERIVPA